MPDFSQQRDTLDPAENLLNPFAFPLAHHESAVPGGARVDVARTPGVRTHMRSHAHRPRPRHKIAFVETFVAAYGLATLAAHRPQQLQRRLALRFRIRHRHPHTHRQAVAILAQHVPHVHQFKRCAP